jgi:O-6-methylguanine DNA methyltransferase
MQTDAGHVETGWLEMLDGPGENGRTVESLGTADPRLLSDFCRRLLHAMRGQLMDFDDIETPPGTGFQRAVWNATRLIPPGATITYGQLAERVDRPKAARAVGQAMRRNRLPIVIPCHRVIGAGDLGGFGGHGPKGQWPAIKRTLLAAESRSGPRKIPTTHLEC